MAKKRRTTRVKRRKKESGSIEPGTRQTISGIALVTAGILLMLVLRNEAGVIGTAVQRFLTFFFGRWGVLFPIALTVAGVLRFFPVDHGIQVKRNVGLVLCFAAFLGLMHIGAPLEDIGPKRDMLAGAVGFLMSVPFLLFMSRAVGYTMLSAGFLCGLFLAFETDVRTVVMLAIKAMQRPKPKRALTEEDVLKKSVAVTADDEEEDLDLIEDDSEAPELNIVRPSFAQAMAKREADKVKSDAAKKAAKDGDVLEIKDTRFEEWTFPELSLLDSAHSELTVDDEALKRQAKMIEEKLKEFDVDVTVRDARPGPTVTQFTLKPSDGVKISRIENLKNDLALALAAQSLRIEAPIPGKSLVGIEMPNEKRTVVHLKEILESSAFADSDSSLMFPLGRDVSGEAVVARLDDMPHLLIAGATGSGKSVCMNVFLTALLFQNAPHQLKFILVDPKRVELMPYNGIPHLLTPVITESEKALQALRWAVAEMGRRLHRFSENGVRNIEEYNEKQTEEEFLLPRIVIVIDELADLMMRQFRRDTETMIVRISQMARATGMHLVIATQRPSVDVITGLIKANIPTRIAFRTVSSVDSRTILDGIGAEDLLGRGDMLYMTASTQKPVRIQGIFVSTKEVERVINAVKIAGGGKITEQIGLADEEETSQQQPFAAADGAAGAGMVSSIDLDADDNGGDDLFFEAVKVVQASGKASASLLQRQLKVGYARAARLLDIMEEKGLIGPVDGAKARKVYMEKVTV